MQRYPGKYKSRRKWYLGTPRGGGNSTINQGWILVTGIWNDGGHWADEKEWKDN